MWRSRTADSSAEQRHGTLGRARIAWRGNSAGSNREWWDRYDWSGGGEEWTASAEWKQALIDDVLLPLIPAGAAVLEIGPGAGRWSEVLAPRAPGSCSSTSARSRCVAVASV